MSIYSEPRNVSDQQECYFYHTMNLPGIGKIEGNWDLGPKLGPLCARNWQTIAELRQHAGDDAGAATASKSVAQCHVEGMQRY